MPKFLLCSALIAFVSHYGEECVLRGRTIIHKRAQPKNLYNEDEMSCASDQDLEQKASGSELVSCESWRLSVSGSRRYPKKSAANALRCPHRAQISPDYSWASSLCSSLGACHKYWGCAIPRILKLAHDNLLETPPARKSSAEAIATT